MFLFEMLEVYKKSLHFSECVILLCRGLKDRAIKDQLGRAALSIPINIAEGQGRNHCREKRQFYWIARGSLCECIPLLQLCSRLGYVDIKEYENLYGLANEISRMIAGLIRSINTEDSGE